MGFPSPARGYEGKRISLDQQFIHHPSATFFMRAGTTYWRAGIMSGSLLIIDRSLKPVHGSIVTCALGGQFVLRRLRLTPHAYLENIDEPGVIEQLPDGMDDDVVFGVVAYVVNDTRPGGFDENPAI